MSLEQYKQVIHEDFSKNADFIDQIIKDLRLDHNLNILDIGTGLGAMSILLALNDYRVLTGQPKHDPEWEKIHEHHCEHVHDVHAPYGDWKSNAQAIGVDDKITFRHLDAEHLDFANETFDAIFMYDTLQHVAHREDTLNECIRVIKPDGVICVIEWNERSIQADEAQYEFTIDYIDPRTILQRDDVSIEMLAGTWVNAFLIKRKAS
ncbi:MAG: class I SAM-dependent methyltransferase [Candidatus Thorarchaeota archaeon]|jgi:ubiquinone/menaquinone biosynthesis C-methylase UbiE